MEAKFQLAVELIDGEIEKLRKRIDALAQERAALLSGAGVQNAHPRPVVAGGAGPAHEGTRNNGSLLVLHQAIDRALTDEGGHPISVKDVRKRVLALPIKSSPSAPAVRGTLNDKAAEYGWKKTGSGRGTRWYKPRAHTQEASS